jgi:hypothetical protein
MSGLRVSGVVAERSALAAALRVDVDAAADVVVALLLVVVVVAAAVRAALAGA